MTTGVASASPATAPAGAVVKVTGERVYVSLGTHDGAAPGAPVVLFETVSLPGPGPVRQEYVPVARSFLAEVGERVSYARVALAVADRIEVGDRVELVLPDAATTPADEAPQAAGPGDIVVGTSTYETAAPLLFDVFDPVGGGAFVLHYRFDREPEYTRLDLKAAGEGHHHAAIPAELHQARTLSWYLTVTRGGVLAFVGGNPAQPTRLQAPRAVVPAAPIPEWRTVSPARRARELGYDHSRPGTIAWGDVLGFAVYAPPPLRTPRVHYRIAGELTYHREAMVAEPNDHFTFVVPATGVAAPAMEYYLTVEDGDGHELLASGTPERPERVAVKADVFDIGAQQSRYRGHRHRLNAFGELVSFGGDEFYAHWEADYFYRLFSILYRLRMGLGSYNGQGYLRPATGGDVIPSQQDTVGVAWYYGYSEFEWRFDKYLSVLTKLMLGINNDGVGVGFEGILRIGDELGLNLEIGGLRAADLGTSGLFRLNIPAGRDWMFAGSVWVENLPLDEETGFRMALDANWFVTDNLSLRARVGLAARTIDRIGPNVGLGVAGHF
ncbi:MAG: hypothetical protein EP329_10060 [Deltaproteobacteria bacterium]|nr:MAG: hypothetical protein EP329_10060 [Deltaproteobacteria bacterium]